MNSSENVNDLEELQSRVAFFEDFLSNLDKKIVEQDREIVALQLQVRHLNEKLQGLSNELGAGDAYGSEGGQEVPPHY